MIGGRGNYEWRRKRNLERRSRRRRELREEQEELMRVGSFESSRMRQFHHLAKLIDR